MESKAMPTVEESFNKMFTEQYGEDLYSVIFINNESYKSTDVEEFMFKVSHEYAVLFAKHKVRECKEVIREEVKKSFIYSAQTQINDLIENAYSEDNVK